MSGFVFSADERISVPDTGFPKIFDGILELFFVRNSDQSALCCAFFAEDTRILLELTCMVDYCVERRHATQVRYLCGGSLKFKASRHVLQINQFYVNNIISSFLTIM